MKRILSFSCPINSQAKYPRRIRSSHVTSRQVKLEFLVHVTHALDCLNYIFFCRYMQARWWKMSENLWGWWCSGRCCMLGSWAFVTWTGSRVNPFKEWLCCSFIYILRSFIPLRLPNYGSSRGGLLRYTHEGVLIFGKKASSLRRVITCKGSIKRGCKYRIRNLQKLEAFWLFWDLSWDFVCSRTDTWLQLSELSDQKL